VIFNWGLLDGRWRILIFAGLIAPPATSVQSTVWGRRGWVFGRMQKRVCDADGKIATFELLGPPAPGSPGGRARFLLSAFQIAVTECCTV
jgi:hypothetical protein